MFFDLPTRVGLASFATLDAVVYGWSAYVIEADDISSRLALAALALAMLAIAWAAVIKPENLKPMFSNWITRLGVSALLIAPLFVGARSVIASFD